MTHHKFKFSINLARPVQRAITLAFILGMALVGSNRANAQFVVNIYQQGSNVVAIGSGSIDLTGLSFDHSGTMPGIGVIPSDGVLTIGSPEDWSAYSGVSNASAFGSGGLHFATSGSGNYVAMVGFASDVEVPLDYISGTHLSDSMTWDNTTLSTLGITPGTYTWNWGDGAGTFTLNVATAPEPSTYALLLGGLAFLGFFVRRKGLNLGRAFPRLLLLSAFFALTCVGAGQARAQSSFTFNLFQDGTNVLATGSGTFDLTGLTFIPAGLTGTTANINPYYGILDVGPISSPYSGYSGISGPSSFGSGGLLFASSTSGNYANIDGFDRLIEVPTGYTSGTHLSDTATFNNATLSSLGITPGTYTWSWNGGADTLTLNAGAVPEPSTYAMLLGGLAFLAFCVRRKVARVK